LQRRRDRRSRSKILSSIAQARGVGPRRRGRSRSLRYEVGDQIAESGDMRPET
jgi:hypothetical protein